eukprot:TRINITY_DN6100_c0_g1_i1.p2 TRINITY_DN6100_c0_g1~~TRINITY_DN6100_c0_g1_i1.p2  ORF type:complete len:125 (-),score=48.05 TRINITY_DN6100_c0_g1_i1:24-398(-)
MIRRPPRSTLSSSSAASDVYKRQDEWEWGESAEAEGSEQVDWDDDTTGWTECEIAPSWPSPEEEATVVENEEWATAGDQLKPGLRKSWQTELSGEKKHRILGAMQGFDPDKVRAERKAKKAAKN